MTEQRVGWALWKWMDNEVDGEFHWVLIDFERNHACGAIKEEPTSLPSKIKCEVHYSGGMVKADQFKIVPVYAKPPEGE